VAGADRDVEGTSIDVDVAFLSGLKVELACPSSHVDRHRPQAGFQLVVDAGPVGTRLDGGELLAERADAVDQLSASGGAGGGRAAQIFLDDTEQPSPDLPFISQPRDGGIVARAASRRWRISE
jgi:hypothetical protein